jgi:predicted ribosome quality control (RQC) complex YloA/Tae2 family protein
MFKNYFYLNRFVTELNPMLVTFYLVDCFSQEKDKLILHFKKNENDKYLILSTSQNDQHIFIRDEYHKAKKNYANFFSDFLPQQLQKIEIAFYDRILKFSLTNAALFYFIRGKATNIIFTNSDKNISNFKKLNQNSAFELLQEFETKKYSLDYNIPDLKTLAADFDFNSDISKKIPFISKEITREARLRTVNGNSYLMNLEKVISEIKTNKICVFKDENTGKTTLAPDGFMTFPNSEKSLFDTYLEAIKYLFSLKYKNDSIEENKKLISRTLNLQLQKTSDKLNEIKYKLEQPSKEEFYRNQANLLLANINLLKKGMEEITIEDFSANGNYYKIKLDKTFTAKRNIDSYFEKAKNEKESRNHLLELYSELEEKYKVLNIIDKKFNESEKIEEFKSIMEELRIKNNTTGSKKEALPNFKHYLIEEKYHVYVGKDSKNNDELTTKFAKQNDYWFHARSVSGSHVVLRVENSKEAIPKPILKKAASIAAYHSKAKTSKLAPVSFALKKYIVKRKGMEPGKVNMLKEDVLLVEPAIPTGCKFITDD